MTKDLTGVKACTACEQDDDGLTIDGKDRIFKARRHGLGKVGAELMIVGRNPTRSPSRCNHGGWGLHKDTPPSHMSQRVVAELVRRMPVALEDMYITNAVKCPTHFNNVPSMFLTSRCASMHLKKEIDLVNPRFILCLGHVAASAVGGIIMSPMVTDRNYKRFHVAGRGDCKGASSTAYANVIVSNHGVDEGTVNESADDYVSDEADGDERWTMINGYSYHPEHMRRFKSGLESAIHPSKAMLYVHRDSWIQSILLAYKWLVRMGV